MVVWVVFVRGFDDAVVGLFCRCVNTDFEVATRRGLVSRRALCWAIGESKSTSRTRAKNSGLSD